MNIELRNIKVHERLSEETTCFDASLYINGKKVGYANNRGTGGPTDYGLDNYHDEAAKKLLKEAEEYCQQLPDRTYSQYNPPLVVKMDLENFIDDLLTEFLEEKYKKDFARQLKKDCLNNICYGTSEAYRKYSWTRGQSKQKVPISEMISNLHGKSAIKEGATVIKKKLKEGERILNTNIPEELL